MNTLFIASKTRPLQNASSSSEFLKDNLLAEALRVPSLEIVIREQIIKDILIFDFES